LKLQVAAGVEASDFLALSGVEVVSQEGKEIVLLFAAEEGLNEFNSRLNALSRDGRASRQDLLFAIQGFEGWSPENRRGRALRREGAPTTGNFVIDVELWPLENSTGRTAIVHAFSAWCSERAIEVIDTLDQRTIVLRRLRVDGAGLELLLGHRDVRTVDLPPSYQLATDILRTPIADIPPVSPPPADAPGIVCLDSGLATGHPLLSNAVGDSQSFLPGAGPEDENGHGSLVAGMALYGDVALAAEKRSFVPLLRLFSGRITNADAQATSGFVEKAVVKAVEYFLSEYGCRVFNLSFGDERQVYEGRQVGTLASILDELAHEHQVLIVVSAGNFSGEDGAPADWRAEYPTYLKDPGARLIDPAPALNALTVGSLARYEVSHMAARFPTDPAFQALARVDEPSPFTRAGPGLNGAIKPELVDYGGNWTLDVRGGSVGTSRELGEMSTNSSFVAGGLFARDNGTSFAAPKIAHQAARLLVDYAEASPDLMRALLLLHADHPEAAVNLLAKEDDRLRLLGYGRPAELPTRECSERCVTMYAQETIGENAYHFYEIPIPEDFVAPPARRPRQIRIALAHTPMVRRSRLEYRMSAFSFRVVRRATLDEVVATFKRARLDQQLDMIPQVGDFRPSARARDKGTAQAAVWKIGQVSSRDWAGKGLFVVVSRRVPAWALGTYRSERYALAVALEDRSEHEVRLYSQVRTRLRARVRIQVTV
jgi:hypothetical protein